MLVMTTVMATGQDNAEAPELPNLPGDTPIRVIQMRNASASNVAGNLRYVMGSQAIISSSGSSVIIRAPENVISVIEAAVQQLDVASSSPGNVELTVQLLYGSAGEGPGDPIPADLESTVEQLQSIFSFQNYRLLDTILLRGRHGSGASSAGMLSLAMPAGVNDSQQYAFVTEFEVVTTEAPRMVRLRSLRLNLNLWFENLPGQEPRHRQVEGNIQTDLDVVEGQKTVVGKSNVSADDAIILVVTPRVVE